MERYARQMVFAPIGKEGQEKLLRSKVAVIGMGALGTVAANHLCRAGVGHIRVVDRDYVEITNLQRQILYDEQDAGQSLPKAIAATNHLCRVNSEITLEPIIADVNPSNIEALVKDTDLVLDATDNFEIRFLMNEACHRHKIPWIYCGALGSAGMTMNILPDGPCFACFMGDSESEPCETCGTAGVLNMVTAAMASIQAAEAVKILLGSGDVRRTLLSVDLWGTSFDAMEIEKDGCCPVCALGQYKRLGKPAGSYTASLCGADSVQVVPPKPVQVDFGELAARLEKIGEVRLSPYALRFSDARYEIMLFQDGRAIIKNAIDGNSAKSVYAEYIGL